MQKSHNSNITQQIKKNLHKEKNFTSPVEEVKLASLCFFSYFIVKIQNYMVERKINIKAFLTIMVRNLHLICILTNIIENYTSLTRNYL